MNWIRRLRGLLTLPPRQVVAVAADGSVSAYRLKLRLDGGIALQSARLWRSRESLIVLDPAIVFRRRLYGRPKQKKALAALLQSAPGLFPFDPASTRYTLVEADGDTFVAALPDATLARISVDLPPARVIVAADERLDSQGVLAAVERWLSSGRTVDFAGRVGDPIPLQGLVTTFLVMATISVLAFVAWAGFGSGWRERQLQTILRELAPEATPLLARHAALERMAAAQNALAALHAQPGVEAHARAVQILSSVPQGVSVRRVEFKNGALEVSGTGGAEARDWLLKLGFSDAQIQLVEVAAYKQYTARLPIGT